LIACIFSVVVWEWLKEASPVETVAVYRNCLFRGFASVLYFETQQHTITWHSLTKRNVAKYTLERMEGIVVVRKYWLVTLGSVSFYLTNQLLTIDSYELESCCDWRNTFFCLLMNYKVAICYCIASWRKRVVRCLLLHFGNFPLKLQLAFVVIFLPG
jgi:hypothetical protein